MEILKKIGKKSLVIGFAMILLFGCSQPTSSSSSGTGNKETVNTENNNESGSNSESGSNGEAGNNSDADNNAEPENSEALRAESEFENIIGSGKKLYFSYLYDLIDYYKDYQFFNITDYENNKLKIEFRVNKCQRHNKDVSEQYYTKIFDNITYKGTDDGFIEFSYFGPKLGYDNTVEDQEQYKLQDEKIEQKIKFKITKHDSKSVTFVVQEGNNKTRNIQWSFKPVYLEGD